ncbi:MAG: hypothetical protein M1837_001376 [Sclerophora amabilis]|nr:MAG: hypothetical protein M1837_001376 [Sclerophora amabilis]
MHGPPATSEEAPNIIQHRIYVTLQQKYAGANPILRSHIMMDPEEQSKFAIHEAAREGRSTSSTFMTSPPHLSGLANNVWLASVVESLLNANPGLSSRRDTDDRLPIHWAISYNHLPIVELLVQRKDFDPDAQDGSGWTPLMIAASLKEGDELVDLLLRKEADVNSKNFSGQTALHFCASKNNLDIARKLVQHKASARVKDKRGQLALHRAAAIGSVPMVKLLIDNRSPLNATDISGLTALHHAISEGHGDTALLLLKAGAETDKRDMDDHLAIDLAPDTKIRAFILQSAAQEGIDLS